jgi:hypothetical protein
MQIHSPLERYELEYIAWFLEDAGADFEDHSCNDLFLPATPENRAIATAICDDADGDSPDADPVRLPGDAADVIQFWDSQAMEFFSRRCRDMAANTDGENRFNNAELILVADLLELAAEDHEDVANDVSFNLTLDVTPEQREMFAKAVDGYLARAQAGAGSDGTAVIAAEIRSNLLPDGSAKTVDIPDYWLMYWLAQRCREIASQD